MKNYKRVSVIIACYNAEKYIDRSINSVFMQDYSNIELIIVNDGSIDNSEKKILDWKRKFESKGYIFVYLYQENGGIGSAINLGLKYVTGDYLTLLDSDDSYLQGSISKRAGFLDNHLDFSGVRSNGWYVKKDSRSLFITSDEEKKIKDLFIALTFGRTNNWAGTYMIRTSVLFGFYLDRNIFPSRLGQNFQLLLPVSYKRKFGFIDEPLMEYNILDNSHSHKSDLNERFLTDESNSMGWRDIYFNVVNMLVCDANEKEYYYNAYNSVFYRRSMNRAIEYNKEKLVNDYFVLLKSTGYLTLDDRISYYTYEKNFFLAISHKIYRKIKLFSRTKGKWSKK